MLGIFGTILYGIFVAKEWCIGETDEQLDKKRAINNGNKLYIDKYGNYRHTDSGRKYSVEDGKKAYQEYCKKQEERQMYWKNRYDQIELEYYVSYYNDFIKDKYSLTYEEWIMASQDVMSRLYQKYKAMFSDEQREKLFNYGFKNKLRK